MENIGHKESYIQPDAQLDQIPENTSNIVHVPNAPPPPLKNIRKPPPPSFPVLKVQMDNEDQLEIMSQKLRGAFLEIATQLRGVNKDIQTKEHIDDAEFDDLDDDDDDDDEEELDDEIQKNESKNSL